MTPGMTPTALAAMIVALLCLAAPAKAAAPATLDRVLPAIARQIPGMLLDARGPVREPDGHAHYEIRWLGEDNRVRWLSADAVTGRISAREKSSDE